MKDGIILIDKEEGMTSRAVDNALGKKFGTRKIGHLGTLDPFATGLLILAINKGTKFLPYIDDSSKTYIASLKLGIKTSTGDRDGEEVIRKEIPPIDEEMIRKCFASFIGESYQTPPMTSAIKIDGVPLYKRAHKGEEIERKPRRIEVFSLDLLSFHEDNLLFSCTVSKGTYIRVLGEDIAEKLGTVGYLDNLRRMKISSFHVGNAKKIDEISEDDILEPTPFINALKHINVKENEVEKIKNGMSYASNIDHGEMILLCHEDKALAVYKKNHKKEGKTIYVSERGLF